MSDNTMDPRQQPLSDEPPFDPAYDLPEADPQPPVDVPMSAVEEGEPPLPIEEPGANPRENAGQEILGAPTPQGGNALERDPEDWVTGDDPATEAQKSYLDSLARAAGEQIPADGLTKAQASEHIDRLQAQTGRQPRQN